MADVKDVKSVDQFSQILRDLRTQSANDPAMKDWPAGLALKPAMNGKVVVNVPQGAGNQSYTLWMERDAAGNFQPVLTTNETLQKVRLNDIYNSVDAPIRDGINPFTGQKMGDDRPAEVLDLKKKAVAFDTIAMERKPAVVVNVPADVLRDAIAQKHLAIKTQVAQKPEMSARPAPHPDAVERSPVTPSPVAASPVPEAPRVEKVTPDAPVAAKPVGLSVAEIAGLKPPAGASYEDQHNTAQAALSALKIMYRDGEASETKMTKGQAEDVIKAHEAANPRFGAVLRGAYKELGGLTELQNGPVDVYNKAVTAMEASYHANKPATRPAPVPQVAENSPAVMSPPKSTGTLNDLGAAYAAGGQLIEVMRYSFMKDAPAAMKMAGEKIERLVSDHMGANKQFGAVLEDVLKKMKASDGSLASVQEIAGDAQSRLGDIFKEEMKKLLPAAVKNPGGMAANKGGEFKEVDFAYNDMPYPKSVNPGMTDQFTMAVYNSVPEPKAPQVEAAPAAGPVVTNVRGLNA